jgi:hypothetical protein
MQQDFPKGYLIARKEKPAGSLSHGRLCTNFREISLHENKSPLRRVWEIQEDAGRSHCMKRKEKLSPAAWKSSASLQQNLPEDFAS